MSKRFLALGVMVVGLAMPSEAALKYAVVSGNSFFPAFTNALNAVAYGGNSNFVAVGVDSKILTGTFTTNTPWLAGNNWADGNLTSAPGINLVGVASSGSQFAALGSASNSVSGHGFTNYVYTSATGLGAWSYAASAITNIVAASGLGFNQNAFVASAYDQEFWYSTDLVNWGAGKLQNQQSGEANRGVAANGTNGFVACGVLGVVRSSTDGGQTWARTHAGSTAFPNLLGIAANGVSTIVCVGTNVTGAAAAKGTIFTSPNGGASWVSGALTNGAGAYIPTNTIPPLYGAAYSGTNDGFVAVGKDGSIFASADGLAWIQQTNGLPSGFATNLQGVAFATGGLMSGVGIIVGEGGTVILASDPPPAPINPVGATNCETTPNPPSNPALSVSVVVSANFPPGTTTVDWYDAPAGGNQITNNSTLFVPTNNAAAGPNTAGYYTNYAEARDWRTGFTSTNRTPVVLQINPRPRAVLISTNLTGFVFATTNCNLGTSYTITNQLTGVGPWTVWWNDGTVQTADASPGNPVALLRTVVPMNPFLNAPSNNLYYVTIVSNADTCTGNFPGNSTVLPDVVGTNAILINPRPTATLLSTNFPNYQFFSTNCNYGTAYVLTNVLTGLGPWTVTWNDGTTTTVGNNLWGPYTNGYTVYPTNAYGANAASNNIFYITNLFDANGCNGSQPSDIRGTNTVTVNPRPTATLVSTNLANYVFAVTNCNYGTNYTLTNILTGIGPWTVTWSSNGVPATQVVGSSGPGPFFFTVTVYPTNAYGANTWSNNIYFITGLSDANLCAGNEPGDIRGTNAVTVNPRPTATLVSTNSPNYQFYSTNCNYGTPYTLTNILTGIGPWTVAWSSNGVPVTQLVGNSGSGPYTYAFTVYPTNANGANLWSDNIYYITNLYDANTCNGNEPGDIKGTNVIVVNPRPTATLVSADTNLCNYGFAYIITANLTGLTNWNVTWWDGAVSNYTASLGATGVASRVVYPTNPLANLPTNNLYWIAGVTNINGCFSCGGGCTNWATDIAGTNTVVVDPRPTVVVYGTNAICNGNPYLIQAQLTGLTNWNVTWWDGAVSNYTANFGATGVASRVVYPTNLLANVPTNYQYWILGLTNLNGCLSCGGGCTNWTADITGTNSVTVNPRPTATLVSTDTNLCNYGFAYTITANLTGLTNWNVTWWDGVVSNYTASFGATGVAYRVVYPTNPLANLPTNILYWIAGVTNLNGCLSCGGGCTNWAIDIKGTNTVVVDPRPTATLVNANTNLCNNGLPYTITANLTGLTNWNVTWWDGAVSNYTANLGATGVAWRVVSPTNLLANVPTNYQYWILGVTNLNGCLSCGGGCTNWTADITGTNTVTVNPLPTGALIMNNSSSFFSVTNNAFNGLIVSSNSSGFMVGVPFGAKVHSQQVSLPMNLLSIRTRVYLPKQGSYALQDGYTVTNGSQSAGTKDYVWSELIYRDSLPTNFTFSIANLTNSNTACVADAGGITNNNVQVQVYWILTADVSVSNQNAITVCGSATNIEIEAQLEGPTTNFNVIWWDGSSNHYTTNFVIKINTNGLTNPGQTQITTNYYIQSISAPSLNATNNSSVTNSFASVIVDPLPTNPPNSLGNVTNCMAVAVPVTLAVGVPPNFTADWYGDSFGTNLLASGSTNVEVVIAGGNMLVYWGTNGPVTNFNAAISSGTNSFFTNTFWVAARYNDLNLTNTCYSAFTNVLLSTTNCSNQLSILPLSGSNVLIQWYGNYLLQQNTNLLNPGGWTNVTAGIGGSNGLPLPPTNAAGFFRLFAPTNWP